MGLKPTSTFAKAISRRRPAVLGRHPPRLQLTMDHIRLYRLANAQTPQLLQQAAIEVGYLERILRMFAFNPPRRIALRGTRSQIEGASGLIEARENAR